MITQLRLCLKCNSERNVDEFVKDKTRKDGLHP